MEHGVFITKVTLFRKNLYPKSMIMKKSALLLILALGFSYANCQQQWDVTLYKNRDFLEFNSAYDQITVMDVDREGNVWFNLYNTWGGAGMGKFTGKDWISFNLGTDLLNLGFYVNAFAFDLENNVWAGTYNGLAQFDGISKDGWNIYNMENGDIPDNNITAIAIDNKNIKWIGFGNGYLASFDGSKWIPYDQYAKTGEAINDLETDPEGNIWIARNGTPGLLKFRDETFTEFIDLTDIRNIETTVFGNVMVTSRDSLVILKNDKIIEVVKPDPLLDCELYDVAYSDGVFVSSNRGILEKVNSTFKLYSENNSTLPELVPPNNFNPIPVESDGIAGLWFPFIYEGISARYASIGIMRKKDEVLPPPVTSSISNKFCFGDSITVDANSNAAHYIWDGVRSKNRTYTVYDTKTINLTTVVEENRLMDTLEVKVNNVWIDTVVCVQSDQTYSNASIEVIAQHVYEDEEPCVATVSSDYTNLVVWERTPYVGTASYNIFKETETPGEYQFLANIPVGQLSVFEDVLSDPRQGSSKYKIASIDTCGNESGPSIYHKTMHLDISTGMDSTEVVLTWDSYEGISFSDYIIYKGTDPDSLQLVDSIPYIDTPTWTDYDVIGNYYYCVGVQLEIPCAPADYQGKKVDSGPYSQSMSNIEDNRLKTFIDEPGFLEVLSYPNPFSHWTQIDFENPAKYPFLLRVTDMNGKTVRMVDNIRDNKVILLRENLPAGFYLFELKGDKVYRGKFAIR
jgi:hypothetical protein